MKKFTIITSTLLLLSISLLGQTASKVHTQSGLIKSLKAYSAGVIFISEDDIADRIVHSVDGLSSYTSVQDLIKGTANQLMAFDDDDVAVFIGDADNGKGKELYAVNNGMTSLVLDHANFSAGKPDTIMGRIHDGFGYQFFYTLRETEQYGEIIAEVANDLWYTDGTDYGTWDLSLANMRIKKHSGFTVYKGRIYYGGNIYGLGGRSCDTRIYSLPVSNLSAVAQENVAFYNVDCLFAEPKNLIATESDVYCTFIDAHNGHKSLHRLEEVSTDAPAGLYRMIDLVQVGREDVVRDQVSVDDGMVTVGNKLYCIISENTILESGYSDVVVSEVEKLYVVEGRQYSVVSNIKGDGNSDQLSELTQSGDHLYFFSGEGSEKKLFLYDTNLQDGPHYVADAPYGAHLTATHNGVVYTTGEGAGMQVMTTNGANVNQVSMSAEFVGEVSHIMTSGNQVYVSHVNGVFTHISHFISDLAASAKSNNVLARVSVSPNPVESLMYVESNQPVIGVEVFSITGLKVLSVAADLITSVDMSELIKGIYIVKITDVNNQTSIKKMNKL